MNSKIISFSEITANHGKKFKEFSDSTLIFNGNFLQKTLEDTIKVLNLMKKYRVIPIENSSCSEVERALANNLLDPTNKFIARNLINKTETEKYEKLKESFQYYTNNKVKYLIENRTLYLGGILNLYEGLETEELMESDEFPINEEIINMFLDVDYDVDKIVLPLRKFCDYGFSTKIGKYEIISTSSKPTKHDQSFGKKCISDSLCFYDGENIFGISSCKINYRYAPHEMVVCVRQNVDNDQVLFFKIFTAQKISIWFNQYKNIIMSTGKKASPFNLVEYTLDDFFQGKYIDKQEEFSINKNSPQIHSPVQSPVER